MDDLNAIFEGCKQKDRRCQEKLYRQFYPALFALCRRYIRDPHECLTALNNGMLNVFNHIDQFDPARGNLFNWIYTIVRHAAVAAVRTNNSLSYQELDEQTLDDLQINPFRQLEWKDIFFYLDKLPEQTRLVCSMFYLEGCSIKEISQTIGMKEGTVKWQLSECRHRLKTIFEKQFRIEKSA